MKKKTKVLHFAPGFNIGGIESRMLDWYRNINRELIQFILVKANDIDNTPYIKEFVDLGGKFYNLPLYGLKTSFGYEKRLINIIKKEKIDIIHVHDLNSGLIALKAAKKCGITCRILHSRTNSFLPKEKNKLIKKIFMKLSPKYATDYFACSYNAGIWGIGTRYKDEIVVVKNGIQDDLFVYDEIKRYELRKKLDISDKKVVGFLGRFSPQKNLEFLFDIFNSLCRLDNNYVLLLVGSGNNAIIESCFSAYPDIRKKVIMVGPKKNVWDYYMAMDIFCGTSFYEGFGTTAIESQATGLPTIISTGFPKEVEITDFVKRLPLDNKDVWINEIQKIIGERYPIEGIDSVISNGYSASVVAKKLEHFYIENARG